ncbi:MAG: hypothetical protein A2365_02825 [Candidatus Nealsonbacteria bacterium RIFOXYB1_FULL_40_15]|uniref:CYTH domain-containing protein n=1 Tax=Candidatus Nealsonbacteria bacterium RIFOXYB1_FULL_40_15 TaxID=1801677 RepID=A0A1G2EQY5_9BACT|nr:MAG: hypothetical protein A2365_02825 [Candidatus Nealsonbacteria bacterium RIFOXYB1_FULL_40_15]
MNTKSTVEEESWGLLTKAQFDLFLDRFTKQFGQPTRSKRLSFSFWDHNRNKIDTRIKITDGRAEIIQKVGTWEGVTKWARTEQRVSLPSDTQEIFNVYQIFRVLVPGKNTCHILQHDNFLFKQPGFEIKLTHQYGKTDKYNFEVEANNQKTNLARILDSLGLTKLVTVTDTKFWDKWNGELNLKDTDLSTKQIQDLIKKHLS